jgi:hypothetical protein
MKIRTAFFLLIAAGVLGTSLMLPPVRFEEAEPPETVAGERLLARPP